MMYLLEEAKPRYLSMSMIFRQERECFNSLLPHRGESPASPQNQVYQRGGGAASTRDPLPAGNRPHLDQHSETTRKRTQRRRHSKRKYRPKG